MADVIDWANPCEVAVALKEAKYKIASGVQTARVRFKSGDAEREVQFNATTLKEINIALREAEAECAALNGERPSRFAIGTDFRRRYPWGS